MYGSSSIPLLLEINRSILPLLMYKLSSFNRATVLGCVELIAKLATNNENLNLFEASPEHFFCKLVG
jgi:hypothetical protein